MCTPAVAENILLAKFYPRTRGLKNLVANLILYVHCTVLPTSQNLQQKYLLTNGELPPQLYMNQACRAGGINTITVSTQLPDLKLLYGATCSLPAGPDTCYHPVTYIVYNLKGQCHANDVRLVLTHWSYEGVQVGLISLYRGPRAPCFWTKHVLPSSVLQCPT